MTTYEVRAQWDPDAKVWWAVSEDVPGLASEAPSFEELLNNIRELVPELLALNDAPTATSDLTIKVHAERIEVLRVA
jgi:predicted RNase H-like HicB family nuclease